MCDVVRLRVGGEVFEAEKETLLRFDHTFFHGLFSSGAWQPEADGAYFIDRPAIGFDRILEYLNSGELSVEGLSEEEEDCMYSSLDYLLIPYKRQWRYDTESLIERFVVTCVCELSNGRLCGVNEFDDTSILVWNMDTGVFEVTLEGHTDSINQVIQLQDGRVCSCSWDTTIKIWSIDNGLCELTLTGHTDAVHSILQLFDGRVCSGSMDKAIRVWNSSTGERAMTMVTEFLIYCLVQLADGRICCGNDGGNLSFYNLRTEKCEQFWSTYSECVHVIMCIDATRVCSGYNYGTIEVWNTDTGECELTLEGRSGQVTSMVLMQDGRLCSASVYSAPMLWNLETGECEKTMSTTYGCTQVLQLEDGRLLSISEKYRNFVVWS